MSLRDYYDCPLSEEEKNLLAENLILVMEGRLPDEKEYYVDENYRDIFRYCFDRDERLKEKVKENLRPRNTYKPSEELMILKKQLSKSSKSIPIAIITSLLSFVIWAVSNLLCGTIIAFLIVVIMQLPILSTLLNSLLKVRGDSVTSFTVTISYLLTWYITNMFIEKTNRKYPSQVKYVKYALGIFLVLIAVGNVSALMNNEVSVFGLTISSIAAIVQIVHAKNGKMVLD